MLRSLRFILSLTAVLLVARAVAGQPDVTPPELEHFERAELPAGARASGAVLMELTIDADGAVSDVKLVAGASEELDRAALDAAKKFRFVPARRGGKAIPVTIQYRYVFGPDEADTPPPDTRADRSRTKDPAKPAAPAAPPETGPSGSGPAAPEPEFVASAEVEAPPKSAVRRSFDASEAARVPGVRGDAIRAVDTLPGVARSSDVDTPVIRGSSSSESQVFLDGAPVPLLFHFGGITSFFQSRLIQRVDLYPGNFPARYGRVSGGVVDVTPRRLKSDRLHAMLDLSVLDSAALVEAPVSRKLSLAAAARRSNVDFFFDAFVPEDSYNVVAAPVYFDYQVIADYRASVRQDLRLMAYGSRDALRLVFAKPNQEDPSLRGDVGGSVAFHRLNASYDARLGRDASSTTSLTTGFQQLKFAFGPLVQELTAYELYARIELKLFLDEAVDLDLGVDFFGQLANGRYYGPRPSGWDDADSSGDESPSLGRNIDVSDDDIRIVQPALYAELGLRPLSGVLIAPSVRADYYGNTGSVTLDPRLSTRAAISDRTTLKAGVGVYSQPPQWYEVFEGVGNPELDPYRAIHWGAGFEQKLFRGVELGVEGFYKRILNRVVGVSGGRPPYLVNDGDGRVAGAELSLALRPSEQTFGYLAYTLSRSQRRDADGDWYLFAADQTHVLSAVFSQKLGRGWEVGGRFRYVTGNPSTPVVRAVYDAGIDQYRPVYGAVNSERDPAFHQLDVRVEKVWRWSEFSLAAYLEVLNAYNAQNQEGARYSYDYSRREAGTGLPILPNVGIRGEL